MPLLHPLVLLLLLWWVVPPSSSSLSLDPSVPLADTPRCASIEYQYPFGFPNVSRFMEGFQLTCDPLEGGNATLYLGATQLNIVEISIVQGYVRVEVGPIAWGCGRRRGRGRSNPDPDSGFSLEGTPYTFNNTRNKFTVIGCDALVTFHAPGLNTSSGCASFCATEDSVIDGSCSGVGCCQAAVPKGLKSFNWDFESIRNLTRSRRIDNGTSCSRAYLLEEEGFVFSAHDLDESSTEYTGHAVVVLDWAIGHDNCEVAQQRNNEASFACKDNAVCYDVPTGGGGYRCNCTDGHTGNPYVGCHDIDECSDPLMNPCVWKCKNLEGSFICACPFGRSGDGRKEGTGCERVQPVEIALGVGLSLLFILIIGSFWSYWAFDKRKAIKLRHKYFRQNGGLLLQQHMVSSRQMATRIFGADELERATENFNESRVVGRGGYGTVYKGILSDQRVVAIKKSKLVDETQIEQFINEVIVLSRINHENVVKLLGCCLETQVPLLVYEFISNGTLFSHLHNNDTATSMSWENRLRIAVETARALAHLHSTTPIPIIHRDIKSANILLDENFTAKVSDFGASRLVPYDHTHVTTVVQGTVGYLDPEYFHTSQLTGKSDVYSFGVVLVELLTKRNPVSFYRSEGERNLISYFVSLVEENSHLELIDRQIVEEAGAMHLFVVAQLARRCLSVTGKERPKMKEVAVELDALRRLLKQHLDQERHEKEDSSPGLPSCL